MHTLHTSIDGALKDMKNREVKNVFVIGGSKLVENAINTPYFKGAYITFIQFIWFIIPELNWISYKN